MFKIGQHMVKLQERKLTA